MSSVGDSKTIGAATTSMEPPSATRGASPHFSPPRGAAHYHDTSPSTVAIYRDAEEAYSEVVQVITLSRLLIIESIKRICGSHRSLYLKAHDLVAQLRVRLQILQ